jgi:2-polyprenyl-6-methoxyphenol hydroxylase-like FAD-dependent oxidoreductase
MRVLIIGGGIAGLTTALAFCRKGFETTVLEAAPEVNPVGKGIWVPTNAMLVLERLGVAQAVQKAGWPLDSIQLRTVKGKVLSTVDLIAVKARFGHTTNSIHRARLVETLASALPGGVLRVGKRLTQIGASIGANKEPGRVCAHFEDGSSETADLLVGADGLHSSVRQSLNPVPLRYSGQTCYRGISHCTLPPALANVCWEVWGGECRSGFSQVTRDQVYWFAPRTSPSGGYDSAGQAKARLIESYARFPDPIPQIVAAAQPEGIIRTDLFDFPPIARWANGNVVLVGDAAHAMTPNLGQGGAQAIEDAYVLAEQVAAQPSLATALNQYQSIRQAKANRIANMAYRLGKIAHWRNLVAQALRDFVFQSTPDRVSQRQAESLYALNY